LDSLKRKERRSWKKVVEGDLDYIASELKTVLEKPSVIILSGEVGAGKTTFTKKFVGEDSAQSPSYSLINEVGDMAHADFYRIENSNELVHMEISLYLENKEYFLIEWGLPFVSHLRKELDERFDFFELNVAINSNSENVLGDVPTRNFTLFELPEV